MEAAADRLLLHPFQALLFFFLDGRQDWTLSPYVLDDFLHILRRRGARKADSGLNGDTFGRSDIALEDKR